jgi:glycosyltransferase involved in cell wall biosynthesis
VEDVAPWRTLPRRLRYLAHAARTYDVFHFNFGSTILPVWRFAVAVDELPLLKRMGKVILATFQGSDARPPARWPAPPEDRVFRRTLERRQERARSRLLRYADRVFYLNPDLSEWLPGARFCPYASVDPRELEPVPQRGSGEQTVVHAPSRRGPKGTAEVIAAVGALRSRGLPVRLDLVEGVRREEALARCARADIAVDQLHLGWYGGFAVEAMALGKPVLCHISEERPAESPFHVELPIARTTAATLERDLLALLEDPARRSRLGAEGRRFVERHHDPRRIARTALQGLVALP